MPVKYAVIGTGRVARQVLAQAHAAGDSVKVLARHSGQLREVAPAIGIVEGDVDDPAALDATLSGRDVVISTLGEDRVSGASPYSHTARSILAGMQRTGVHRLIALSSAGVEHDPSIPSLVESVVLPVLYGRVFADLRAMEDILSRCRVDWTVVRPARLTNGPRTGNYRYDERFLPPGGSSISRADLADFLLRVAADGLYVRTRAAVAY